MLGLDFIRAHSEEVREALKKRGEDFPLDELLEMDRRRRQLLVESEGLRARRREESRRIGKTGEKSEATLAELRALGERVQELEKERETLEEKLNDLLLRIPNIPHSTVPEGLDERYNQVVRRWGQPREFDFTPHPHWELGERLGILDFERGAKISGSRFYVLRGLGAKLERALINWMIDLHTREHGYTEVATPYLVKRETMVGTGQLPKFEIEMYRCDLDDLFLIPTAEVSVTNLHREEVLEPGTLPIYYICYTACFRREAGSAGKDTRGVIRVHQFDKVEMVKFVAPETSYEELEKLTDNAEDILRKLGIPHQAVLLCTGDLGFASAKTYDIEAWMPGQGKHVEVSSCSNFEAFQARRANIKYRPAPGARAEFVHTLNGSGLAIGRTFAAVLENYQQRDGSVAVPEALRPYMGVEVIR